MKLRGAVLLFVIQSFCLPVARAVEGTCVGGVCADGYTGCGCDAECCRRRLSGGGSAPAYDYEAERLRRLAEETARRHKEAGEFNARGEASYEREEWNAAIAAFFRAVGLWPENTTFPENLKKARTAKAKDKVETLKRMKGASFESTSTVNDVQDSVPPLKDAVDEHVPPPALEEDPCQAEDNFTGYLERETGRKTNLANLNIALASDSSLKPRVDWCRLHLPLPPSAAASGYCEKKLKYEKRMDLWRIRCAALAAPPPQTTAISSMAGGLTAAAGKARTGADCLGVYDGAAKGCGGHDSLQSLSDCIKAAIGIYHNCLGKVSRADVSLSGDK